MMAKKEDVQEKLVFDDDTDDSDDDLDTFRQNYQHIFILNCFYNKWQDINSKKSSPFIKYEGVHFVCVLNSMEL